MAEQETYQLVLSTDLGLSPSDIVAAWHADQQAASKADIQLLSTTTRSYDPALLNQIITLTTSVGTGVLTSAVYAALKAAVSKKHTQSPDKHFKVTLVEQQDGSKILVVEADETPGEADKS